MRRGAGLWIDHRKAVIVFVADQGQVLLEVRSDVERQFRLHGGQRAKTSYGPQQAPPDDKRETAFMGHLAVYFERLVACLRDEPVIFIFVENRLLPSTLPGRLGSPSKR